jgi:hypothetical protein
MPAAVREGVMAMVGMTWWHHFPKRYLNGHNTPVSDLIDETGTVGVPAKSASPDNREATRYLAAATHLDIRYAEFVVNEVLNERFRALAPTFGVNVPVVARWAIKALRTRALRDCALTAVTLLLLLVPFIALLWLPVLILLPLLLIAAWLIVSGEHWQRIHNVVTHEMLRDRFDPNDAPEPRRKTDRALLEELAKRRPDNLVVFSGHSAFIGSGRRLQRDHVLLDVSRGIETEDGHQQAPQPFTSQDLHTAIVKAFDDRDGLGARLDNVRVCERLFVNGLHLQNDQHLRPAPRRAPEAKVDHGLLREAAHHPTPEARTYVCIEMPGWRGQLVVTLFVRAVLVGASLYLEWQFRVLPPLHKNFLQIDRYYRVPLYHQLKQSLRAGMKEMVAELVAAPFKTAQAWYRPRRARRRELGQRYAIKHGYVFDYGARASIRERASGRQRHHYFLARDETMYVLLAQRALSQAVEDFLRDHEVDLGEFNEQVKVIINRTLNSFNVGDIKDNEGPIVVGSNSTVKTDGNPKGTS